MVLNVVKNLDFKNKRNFLRRFFCGADDKGFQHGYMLGAWSEQYIMPVVRHGQRQTKGRVFSFALP
jgi:hypothetical protein